MPDRIEEKLTVDPNREVQDRHFIEVFEESDRPYLSRAMVQRELDISAETARERLGQLVEREILGTDQVGGAHIYWLKHKDSNWPIPPDVEVSPVNESLTVSDVLDARWGQFGLAGVLILVFSGFLAIGFTGFVANGVSPPFVSVTQLLVWTIAASMVGVMLLMAGVVFWLVDRRRGASDG